MFPGHNRGNRGRRRAITLQQPSRSAARGRRVSTPVAAGGFGAFSDVAWRSLAVVSRVRSSYRPRQRIPGFGHCGTHRACRRPRHNRSSRSLSRPTFDRRIARRDDLHSTVDAHALRPHVCQGKNEKSSVSVRPVPGRDPSRDRKGARHPPARIWARMRALLHPATLTRPAAFGRVTHVLSRRVIRHRSDGEVPRRSRLLSAERQMTSPEPILPTTP